MKLLNKIVILFLLFLSVSFYSYLQNRKVVPVIPTPTPTMTATNSVLGARTKVAGCVARDGMPDHDCTPGQAFPDVTASEVCVSGYSKSVRNVPERVKNAVYTEYGVATHTTGEYEVDHLISLELGGSNDIANLWPEPANPTPGFHEKDRVENYLHSQVCKNLMTLQQAQEIIANNWKSVVIK